MAKFNLHSEFGSQKPPETADTQNCSRTEVLLADADGSHDPLDSLGPEVQTLFDAHIAACTRCSSMLADARRGAAWLETLRSHRPEPPHDLVSRILAQTSLAQTSLAQGVSAQTSASTAGVFAADRAFGDRSSLIANLPTGVSSQAPVATGSSLPASASYPSSNVLPFRARVAASLRPWKHTVLQPRLAMTAAMAFFSVALTLDVTGIHLNQLRASELRPANLKRSFYAANAHVARYYDNLRVVYELESRVHDLQRSSADDAPREQTPSQPSNTEPDIRPQSHPQIQQQRSDPNNNQNHPKPNSGTSRRDENAPKDDSASKKTYRISQYPGILALVTLSSPLRVPSPAPNPSPAHVRFATAIAIATSPKKRGDLA